MGRRIPIEYRLEAKIDKTADCWFWNGQLTHNGYGQFVYREGQQTKCMMAHRAVYQVFVGPIPIGKVLDHLCRNRNCVNPEHLEPVTHRENIVRAPRWASDTCKRGHKYGEQADYYTATGLRRCLECHAMRQRKYNKEVRIALSHSKI